MENRILLERESKLKRKDTESGGKKKKIERREEMPKKGTKSAPLQS